MSEFGTEWLDAPFAASECPELRRVRPFSMLHPPEEAALYRYGRDVYRGAGEIIDAGCFLGASTCALGYGLRDNRRLSPEQLRGRIHSFDLFLTPKGDSVKRFVDEGTQPRESFRPQFERNIQPIHEHVVVHAGNLKKSTWRPESVEFLFVDIAKCWETNQKIVDDFFPLLIPGVSIVHQQDYIMQYCPWIQVAMEYYAEHFEILGWAGTSVFFRYLGGLSEAPLISLRSLPVEEKLALLERAEGRFTGPPAWAVEAGRILLVFLEIGQAEALDLIAEHRQRNAGASVPPLRKEFLDTVEEVVRIWNWGIDLERDMTTKFERLEA